MISEADFEDPLEFRPQEGRKRKKRLRPKKKSKNDYDDTIRIKAMINYCLNCVTWDEAKHIVDFIEKTIGMNGPPAILRDINRVKRRFGQMIYGVIKMNAKKVNIKKGLINGPINQIRNNKEVKIE